MGHQFIFKLQTNPIKLVSNANPTFFQGFLKPESDFKACFQRDTNITLIKGKGCSCMLFRVCFL